MEYLLVEDETTIQLTGYLDSNGNLQFGHSSGNLVDNSDALQAEDEGSCIHIKLMDFTSGATTWTINASHAMSGGGTATWTRGTDHASYTFAQYMSNFLEVSITASSGTTKEKIIDIKTKPRGALPDNPI